MFEIRFWAIEGESLKERSVPFPTPVSTGSGSKGSLLLKEGSVSDPCQVTPKEDRQRRWVTSACQEWAQKNSTSEMEFSNKLFLRLPAAHSAHSAHAAHTAHARRTAFPFSRATPRDGLIVWIAVEATGRGECHKGKGEEE
jgi:hypothetical protein